MGSQHQVFGPGQLPIPIQQPFQNKQPALSHSHPAGPPHPPSCSPTSGTSHSRSVQASVASWYSAHQTTIVTAINSH